MSNSRALHSLHIHLSQFQQIVCTTHIPEHGVEPCHAGKLADSVQEHRMGAHNLHFINAEHSNLGDRTIHNLSNTYLAVLTYCRAHFYPAACICGFVRFSAVALFT